MQLQIFTTGGTIDKVYFDAKSQYEVGEPTIGAILTEVGVNFDFAITELFRKDSLDLTDDDRATLRSAVVADPATYILITHGTDTMTDTGEVLMDIPDKTIVLTGALAPARFRTSDAAFNVGCAIGAIQSLPPGVYVAMNGRVFPTDKVRKNRETGNFELI